MRRSEAPLRRTRLPGLRPGGAVGVVGIVGVAVLAVLAVLAVAAAPRGASAQTLLTQEEALALAFPAGEAVERRTAYLSDAQLEEARRLAGDDVEVDQGIVTYYAGFDAGRPAGAAYFDVHRVRTKNEVVMVVVAPDRTVRRVDVLKFTEPPEYMAPDAWIDQFDGRALDQALSVRGDIHNVTGATLTARALTRAVRRVLALHAVIAPFGAGVAP